MLVSAFDFDLPPERIATRPAEPRENARLLHVDKLSNIIDSQIGKLPDLLRAGDMLVFNDTRVIPARLFGRRGDVAVEILLHKRIGEGRWRCFAKPGKRLKVGDAVIFADGFAAEVAGKESDGQVVLQFPLTDAELHVALERHGHMPLPPYIQSSRADDAKDRHDYQTVYAAREGSVAAPTAGLHFTPALLQALKDKGIQQAYVTLHVGGGTFLPVKVDDTADHVMHSEWAEISAQTADVVNQTRARGGRIIAVGTTSLRTLESAALENGMLAPFSSETDIFITPGYRFKVVDGLVTNFHLPRSTLFMLVCALAGTETMKAAYAHAIREDYRFYSYGDACLLL